MSDPNVLQWDGAYSGDVPHRGRRGRDRPVQRGLRSADRHRRRGVHRRRRERVRPQAAGTDEVAQPGAQAGHHQGRRVHGVAAAGRRRRDGHPQRPVASATPQRSRCWVPTASPGCASGTWSTPSPCAGPVRPSPRMRHPRPSRSWRSPTMASVPADDGAAVVPPMRLGLGALAARSPLLRPRIGVVARRVTAFGRIVGVSGTVRRECAAGRRSGARRGAPPEGVWPEPQGEADPLAGALADDPGMAAIARLYRRGRGQPQETVRRGLPSSTRRGARTASGVLTGPSASPAGCSPPRCASGATRATASRRRPSRRPLGDTAARRLAVRPTARRRRRAARPAAGPAGAVVDRPGPGSGELRPSRHARCPAAAFAAAMRLPRPRRPTRPLRHRSAPPPLAPRRRRRGGGGPPPGAVGRGSRPGARLRRRRWRRRRRPRRRW